jgi:hypothetical protein
MSKEHLSYCTSCSGRTKGVGSLFRGTKGDILLFSPFAHCNSHFNTVAIDLSIWLPATDQAIKPGHSNSSSSSNRSRAFAEL